MKDAATYVLQAPERAIIKGTTADEFVYLGFICEEVFYPEPPLWTKSPTCLFPCPPRFVRSLKDGIYADMSDKYSFKWISVKQHVLTRRTVRHSAQRALEHSTFHLGYPLATVHACADKRLVSMNTYVGRKHALSIERDRTATQLVTSEFDTWQDSEHGICHSLHGLTTIEEAGLTMSSLWGYGVPVQYEYSQRDNDNMIRAIGIPCVLTLQRMSCAFRELDHWKLIEFSEQLYLSETNPVTQCIVTSKPGRLILRDPCGFIKSMIDQRHIGGMGDRREPITVDTTDFYIDEKNNVYTDWKRIDSFLDEALCVLELPALIGIVRQYVYLRTI
jgi:hypothetical protein